MSGSILDVIVVGGGFSGLCTSYYLKHFGLEHIVFERGKIGHSWHQGTWDSFTLQTPNRLNALPGSPYTGHDPDGSPTVGELVVSLEKFVAKNQLPVSENSNVLRIEKIEPAPYFTLTVSHENDGDRKYFCWRVVIASGMFNENIVPSFAQRVMASVTQLHSSEYRNPSQLPDGAVLVVGSGYSGCEVAEELLADGRKVFLSTSAAPQLPRHYKGKDITHWLFESNLLDDKTTDLVDPKEMADLIFSGGAAHGSATILQRLANGGAEFLGSMESAEGEDLFFQDNLNEHLKWIEEYSASIKRRIDEFIVRRKIVVPTEEVEDVNLIGFMKSHEQSSKLLSVSKQNITTILWATGSCGNFSYLKFPGMDERAVMSHQYGISAIEGIYLLGFPWLRNRKSNYLAGIKDDAGYVCNTIYTSIR